MILFHLIPILLSLLYYFLLKKNYKSILFELKKGINCYVCKKEIESLTDYLYKSLTKKEETSSCCNKCKSCERDYKIKRVTQNIVKRKNTFFDDKIRVYFINNGIIFFKIYLILFIIPFIIDIFLLKDVLFITFWNILFWLLFIYYTHITYIKIKK